MFIIRENIEYNKNVFVKVLEIQRPLIQFESGTIIATKVASLYYWKRKETSQN